MIDVSMVLNDPFLTELFDVRRQAEGIDVHGRAAVTPTLFAGQRGRVKPLEGKELERRDDGQLSEHGIQVTCQFALRDARQGFQPDVIIWNGVEYLVVEALPWKIAGFTRAKAHSITTTDPPQGNT